MQPSSAPQYFEREGCIWRRRFSPQGPIETPLCTFTARIVSEILLDDGSERPVLAFEITGERQDGSPLSTITLLASEFPSMQWVTTRWGASALIQAGNSTRDHLRVAIQELSGHPPRRHVYSHLGWAHHEGAWVYLHEGGALCREGALMGVEVRLEGRLKLYRFPPPLGGEALQDAWRQALTLLEAGPPHVMAPLFLAPFRAVLGETRFGLHLVGTPQAGKSELGALVTGFFGADLDPKNFLASWEDTESSLERVLFDAKDAVGLVDDFRPEGARQDVDRAHKKADRVFRGAFNGHGRGRLRADISSRPDHYPRGLVLSTGEDLPRGLSLQSRVLVLRLLKGKTCWAVVSRLQQARDKGVLSGLLARFIAWVSQDLEHHREHREKAQLERRYLFQSSSGRTVDIGADLLSAWDVIQDFGTDLNLERTEELERIGRIITAGMREVVRLQDEHLASSDPAEQFLELLRDGLDSGRCYLRPARESTRNARWGTWLECEPHRFGEFIGFLDPDKQEIWLNSSAVLSSVRELGRGSGREIGLSDLQLWKRLAERGDLVLGEANRNQAKRTPQGGQRGSFIVLRLKALDEKPETLGTTGTELRISLIEPDPSPIGG